MSTRPHRHSLRASFHRNSTVSSISTSPTTISDTTTPTYSNSNSNSNSSYFPPANRSHTLPATLTSASTTSASENRILSTFNPTTTYYIPSHGGLPSPSTSRTTIPILNLTPYLLTRQPEPTPEADRKAFKHTICQILRTHHAELLKSPIFHSRRTGRWNELSAVNPRTGSAEVVGRWRVPWSLHKPAIINGKVEVVTSDWDARSQEFLMGNGAGYRWRRVNEKDLVLEKEMVDYGGGRYVVAVFSVKVCTNAGTRAAGGRGGGRWLWDRTTRADLDLIGGKMRITGQTEGVLVFDERGVERSVAVQSVLVALKRERQRWGVLGGTI